MIPVINQEEGFSGKIVADMSKFTKGQIVTRGPAKNEDEWWNGEDEDTNDAAENSDGQHFTTIHHRTVKVAGLGMNKPGKYTQTAIVTRTDGDGKQTRVITTLGKVTEVINY